MNIRRVGRFECAVIRVIMVVHIWWIGLLLYKNPITSFRTTFQLISRFFKMFEGKKMVRAFMLDNKYYWDMFNPAWPSPGYNSFYRSQLLEERQLKGKQLPIYRRIIFAITKRCPLQCEHCSEAATLYNKDALTVEELQNRIDPFVSGGIGQLIYSGGEPLSRLNDLLVILNRYKSKCEQWIYTSAFGLTPEVAKKLKKAGLNGAAISLDHYDSELHNNFRGNKKSYFWVTEGIKNLQEAGVFVSINVCPTREIVESGGVEKIISLAKDLNVSIVNIIEPRAVGKYEGKEVEYTKAHKEKVSAISAKYNFDNSNFEYPTVLFPSGFRELTSCGGGKSYLFIDYDGTYYPCPFCKTKMPEIRKPQEMLCKAS